MSVYDDGGRRIRLVLSAYARFMHPEIKRADDEEDEDYEYAENRTNLLFTALDDIERIFRWAFHGLFY
jgi:hypothetical protein